MQITISSTSGIQCPRTLHSKKPPSNPDATQYFFQGGTSTWTLRPVSVEGKSVQSPEHECTALRNAQFVKLSRCPANILPSLSDMEAPDRILRRSSRRSTCRITIAVAAVAAIVVAVAVAVAVTFTEKKQPRDPATTILVPLYIYPDPGSWDPLFEA
jgi:hypothetical protein